MIFLLLLLGGLSVPRSFCQRVFGRMILSDHFDIRVACEVSSSDCINCENASIFVDETNVEVVSTTAAGLPSKPTG